MPIIKHSKKPVGQSQYPGSYYRLWLDGYWKDSDSKEIRQQEGFSKVHSRPDFDFSDLRPKETQPRRKRDYLGELIQEGFRYKDIAAALGISHQKLTSIHRNFTSKSPYYEVLRNLSRRLEYNRAREMGATSKQASKTRRELFANADIDFNSEHTRAVLDKSEAFNEAVKHARFQLGGSNWILIEIIRLEWINVIVTT